MKEVKISTNKKIQFINITSKIQNLIPEGFTGLCHIFCQHTTSGLTINENADPYVTEDINYIIEQLIPYNNKNYKHSEGNSSAHIWSSLFNPSMLVPVKDGELCLGTWQAIYFCEFDGPRDNRRFIVSFIKE